MCRKCVCYGKENVEEHDCFYVFKILCIVMCFLVMQGRNATEIYLAKEHNNFFDNKFSARENEKIAMLYGKNVHTT